ncbi:MAG: hypothetical protein QOC66_1664 [Pseudonocardiales bacterium]|jgi:uncharacterized membrane protein YphA (DoxX/SURF4 family)|nr:hypothetical protein [Pseudonocardiales bacterium]
MTITVTVALAALFLLSGTSKVLRHPISLAARDELAVPATVWSAVGAAEVAGAAGVLVGLSVKPLGIAAAAGLVLVGLGAVDAHRRSQDPLTKATPAVVALLLATATLVLFSTGR